MFIAPFGFDKSTWDPSVDKFLPQNYSPDNMKGKSVCKVSLQKHLGLEVHVSVILVSFWPNKNYFLVKDCMLMYGNYLGKICVDMMV